MFDAQICIKMEPELRHALAHLWYAIDALIEGNPSVAKMELKSIESLIFWDGDNFDIEKFFEERNAMKCPKNGSKNCKSSKNCKGKSSSKGSKNCKGKK